MWPGHHTPAVCIKQKGPTVSDLEQFAAECKHAARGLRRVDKDTRRKIAAESRSRIAEPLAGAIARAATGPYAAALAKGTKARTAADPTVVVGGRRKVVRNGASPRDLVFGTEYGGGDRPSHVPARNGHRAYTRSGTRQFVPARPFAVPTTRDRLPAILDEFGEMIAEVLDEGVGRG